jgi:hypothetical protein
MLDFEHDFACEDKIRTNKHMQKLKREGDIGVTKDPNISNPCS